MSAVQLHGTRRYGSCLISKHGLVSWTYSRAPLIVEGANATCGTVGYTAMDGSIGRGGPHVCTSVRTSPALIMFGSDPLRRTLSRRDYHHLLRMWTREAEHLRGPPGPDLSRFNQ